MNRKFLGMTLAVICLSMLATSLIGTAQACGVKHRVTVEPYSSTYVVSIIKPSNPPEVQGDYTIFKGAVSQGSYNGPLGTGTTTAELIKMVINTVTGEAWSFYKNTLVITCGSYGSGTFEGFSWFKFDNVKQQPLTSTNGGTVLHGMGDLKGITVYAEKGGTAISLQSNSVYEKGWLIIS